MTESEAIDKLKNMRLFMQIEDNKNEHKFTEDDYKANEMAIQALEKQIPKKPVHDGCFDSDGMWHEWNGINGRPYDLCPNCNTNLCCEMHYDNKPKYCKHCGQKLDWSDKESEETKL